MLGEGERRRKMESILWVNTIKEGQGVSSAAQIIHLAESNNHLMSAILDMEYRLELSSPDIHEHPQTLQHGQDARIPQSLLASGFTIKVLQVDKYRRCLVIGVVGYECYMID